MTDGNTPDPNSLESLPEWAQKEIKDLRREGQNKGARISTLETELTTVRNDSATKEAQFAQQVSDRSTELSRYRAAVASGVPVDRIDDFASRLRGSTPEELAADAASLAQLLSVNPPAGGTPVPPVHGVDPSQGRGNDQNTPLNPAAQFAEIVRGQLG